MVALLAAVAVDYGFGAAFINDVVAYLIAAYLCLLLALLVGRSGPRHWSRRIVCRLPVAVLVPALVVPSLRGWALVALPLGDFTTTGFSPYIVLPVCALLTVLAFELGARIRPAHCVPIAGAQPPGARGGEPAE